MLKVLIVDDETVVRRGIMLGTDWAAMDCVVVGEASNGEEGLAAAARYNPNLIITDVRMPRMDGIEMMRRLREQDCTAHFIVLTAYDEFDYARSALRYGAADYLLKPFRDQDLVAAIARVREKEGAARPAEDTLLLPKGDKSKYVLQTLNYIAEHYADADINIATIADDLAHSAALRTSESPARARRHSVRLRRVHRALLRRLPPDLQRLLPHRGRRGLRPRRRKI